METCKSQGRRSTMGIKHWNQGVTVESIMATGFIRIRLKNIKEMHAYCMKQKHPDNKVRRKDESRADRCRIQ
eukprot:2374085-Heterocapsa_arctica.AAC.1